MTRDEMFKLYPRQWLIYGFETEGEDDWRFADPNSTDGSYSALLIAVCDSHEETMTVGFEGDGYNVKGIGTTNSMYWDDDYEEPLLAVGGVLVDEESLFCGDDYD